MKLNTNGKTILVVEDEVEVRGYFKTALKCLGYSVELAQDVDEVLAYLTSSGNAVDAVLLDARMPNRNGLDILREIREVDPHLPVIMVSGEPSALDVVSAMRNGAADFLGKPVSIEDLRRAVTTALGTEGAVQAPQARVTANAYLGSNPRMKDLQMLVGRIGRSDAPVLIQGETGSGKEVLARELHAQSPRAAKPFLKLNCAALPSELVESELFGYERGAFTGAFQKKIGMFELADGGTILLDEIGDMEVHLQAKLLQVLQDHSFQRVGGTATVKVDVRVMAATHQDLEERIGDGAFREDLYYRLNVFNLHVPPLRDRKDDIAPLAEFLMKKHAPKDLPMPRITLELRYAMGAYPWPGNVRELENVVRKFLILRDADMLARELQSKSTRKPRASAPTTISRVAPVDCTGGSSPLEHLTRAKNQAEADTILTVLNSTRWNRRRAADLLKTDYKALLYKMKRLGIDEKPVPIDAIPARAASA